MEADAISMSPDQVPTGRWFQLRDGSGSGIGKKTSGSGAGSGTGSGSGIGTAFFINRVLSGIENLDRIFFGYFPDKVFSFGSTKVLAALGRWTQVHVQIQKGFNAILGYCSSRALEILTNKSKGPLKNQIEYQIF